MKNRKQAKRKRPGTYLRDVDVLEHSCELYLLGIKKKKLDKCGKIFRKTFK